MGKKRNQPRHHRIALLFMQGLMSGDFFFIVSFSLSVLHLLNVVYYVIMMGKCLCNLWEQLSRFHDQIDLEAVAVN